VRNIILDDKSLCKGGHLKNLQLGEKGEAKDILN
jgi:hypothetical protein